MEYEPFDGYIAQVFRLDLAIISVVTQSSDESIHLMRQSKLSFEIHELQVMKIPNNVMKRWLSQLSFLGFVWNEVFRGESLKQYYIFIKGEDRRGKYFKTLEYL